MEDWKYREARKRVRKVKGFYGHFTTWIVFSAFFIFLNITTDPHDFWAIFPIMGWGLGVVFHAIGTFGLPGLGKDWESRMLEREIDRIDREQEVKSYHEQQLPSGSRRNTSNTEEESPLPLKEMRKEWRDSDFV